MKITKKQLKKIIKEELQTMVREWDEPEWHEKEYGSGEKGTWDPNRPKEGSWTGPRWEGEGQINWRTSPEPQEAEGVPGQLIGVWGGEGTGWVKTWISDEEWQEVKLRAPKTGSRPIGMKPRGPARLPPSEW